MRTQVEFKSTAFLAAYDGDNFVQELAALGGSGSSTANLLTGDMGPLPQASVRRFPRRRLPAEELVNEPTKKEYLRVNCSYYFFLCHTYRSYDVSCVRFFDCVCSNSFDNCLCNMGAHI